MTSTDLKIRVAKPSDEALMKGFTCSDGITPWQIEVEEFIRNHLLDWTFEPRAAVDDPRCLLAAETGGNDLVGVAAHERVVLQDPLGNPFNATKLEVIAIASDWQGRRLRNGERVSDVLMSALITDVIARVPPRDARLLAIVHEENGRSLACCNGMV